MGVFCAFLFFFAQLKTNFAPFEVIQYFKTNSNFGFSFWQVYFDVKIRIVYIFRK